MVLQELREPTESTVSAVCGSVQPHSRLIWIFMGSAPSGRKSHYLLATLFRQTLIGIIHSTLPIHLYPKVCV